MISSYVRQGQHTLRRWALDPGVQRAARGGVHVLAGFCLSAASLVQGMLPLVMGLVWACRGWRAVLVAAGGALGYGVFWGSGSLQGILWTGLALAGVLLLADKRISRELPLLEVEVELKAGSDERAVAFAGQLAEKYGLVPEKRSKYRRALGLARGEYDV